MKARKTLMSLCLLLALPLAAQQKNYVSEVWVADQGNGKYKNPVLYADYSDPDACRVGDDYYMTSSSFNCLPGLQILHSKDLVNWTIIGAAVPYALSPNDSENIPSIRTGHSTSTPNNSFYLPDECSLFDKLGLSHASDMDSPYDPYYISISTYPNIPIPMQCQNYILLNREYKPLLHEQLLQKRPVEPYSK